MRTEPQDSSRRDPAAQEGTSLFALFNTLLHYRRFIFAVGMSLGVLTGITRLVSPRQYTVKSAFIVQNKDQGAAAGLAAQFGVDVAGIDPTQSPDFYIGLLKVPDVLGSLIDTTFITSKDSRRRSLAEIWRIDDDDPRIRREKTIEHLLSAITSSVALKVDLVSVDVTTIDPLLSTDICKALLAEINRFNLHTRQSRASAERKFTENRMREIKMELSRVEDSVQTFFQTNRQPYMSAGLELRKQGLAHRSDQLQGTFNTLATSYERARIDEVRDTPVITLIRAPELPARPNPRGLVTGTILMFFVGLVLGAIVAFGRQFIRGIRASERTDAQQFSRLLSDTSEDMRRLPSVFPRFAGLLRRARGTGS